jgi:hypothetical protein
MLHLKAARGLGKRLLRMRVVAGSHHAENDVRAPPASPTFSLMRRTETHGRSLRGASGMRGVTAADGASALTRPRYG